MSTSASRSPPREPVNGSITLQEWQAWGTTSPLPTMVTDIVDQMKALEVDIDAHMTFGGSGGKLQVLLQFCLFINIFDSLFGFWES